MSSESGCPVSANCFFRNVVYRFFSVFRILADIFPAYAEVYQRYNLNVERWKLVLRKFKELGLPSTDSLDFLTEEFDRDLFSEIQE